MVPEIASAMRLLRAGARCDPERLPSSSLLRISSKSEAADLVVSSVWIPVSVGVGVVACTDGESVVCVGGLIGCCGEELEEL